MSKRAVYHLEARFIVDPSLIETFRAQCSPSERYTWVSNTERLRIHTFKGVPGKHLDILLPDQETSPFTVCEIGVRTGCFDGKKRWRLTFRSWKVQNTEGHKPSHGYPDKGKLLIEENNTDHVALIALWYEGGMWAQQFPRLRYLVDNRTDLVAIFLNQWKDWYKFIPGEDARQAAELWAALPHTKSQDDIVVLNRTASSALYDLATNMGWRKLTLKDRERIGLGPESQQWQRVERVDQLRLESTSNASGCGDYTVKAAARDNHYIKTAYGLIEE